MRQIAIPGTELKCSRFAFGTASLFNVGTAAARQRLLSAAVATGFTHFDTAPYYGFGSAERDLAPLLKANPSITVTTKVGLYAPGGEDQASPSILIRKALGRVHASLSLPEVNFEVKRARLALDSSLRRLGRQKVELYLLHEPELALLNTDEWLSWLQFEREQGRVGEFGLALAIVRLEPFLSSASLLARVVQIPDSLDYREADLLASDSRPIQITYGYISAARSRGDRRPVELLLRSALARNRTGCVIVSTRHIERLKQYAVIADDKL